MGIFFFALPSHPVVEFCRFTAGAEYRKSKRSGISQEKKESFASLSLQTSTPDTTGWREGREVCFFFIHFCWFPFSQSQTARARRWRMEAKSPLPSTHIDMVNGQRKSSSVLLYASQKQNEILEASKPKARFLSNAISSLFDSIKLCVSHGKGTSFRRESSLLSSQDIFSHLWRSSVCSNAVEMLVKWKTSVLISNRFRKEKKLNRERMKSKHIACRGSGADVAKHAQSAL